MNKDKELELKVQMFCAAVGEKGIDSFYTMASLAAVSYTHLTLPTTERV